MHPRSLAPVLLALAAAALPALASAADNGTNDSAAQATEQVVVPQVERRDVKVPRIPSNDVEFGAYLGTYETQNFGSSAVEGLRLGYHITEDVFVEGVYAQTHVSDASFRQVLPGGVFPQEKEKLKYYNLSAGYNVLPGEVFFGAHHAKTYALYVIGGVGSTTIVDQRKQTFNFGIGSRVFFTDHVAAQVDIRDHIFSLDILGQKQNTQNLELTAGLTFFY
jgi:outer membrane beta-barrel protein